MSDRSTGHVEPPGAADARDAARTAVAAGRTGILGAEDARYEPLPIVTPNGELAGWFIGLVDRDRLLGYVQLDADLRYHRASWFGGIGQAAADWLDPMRVVELARPAMDPGEQPGRPFLSYDASPDRIGWIVPVESAGRTRRLMVAGTSAFELRERGGVG